MAEEVYYCSDNTNGATQFKKKDGQYKRIGFIEKKFKIKLQDDGNIAISDGDEAKQYYCSTLIGAEYKNFKSCVHKYHNGYHLNQDNGRYILFYGFGYVFSNSDSVITSIGTCTKF